MNIFDELNFLRPINLKQGLVLCECGRYKPIPVGCTPEAQRLYLSNLIRNFLIRPDEEHECDPKWIKAELLSSRETVSKRNEKLAEMGVGM